MKRVLVIGGYGGFGTRLCRRLADAGHHVIVAGRSEGKAASFASTLALAEPAMLDRAGDIAMALAGLRPDLVIDAAGPFQGSGLQVPQACIAAAIPYLDLADARDFVTAVPTLDLAARSAGVAAVSGASSLPALSAAAALKLAEGLERVFEVEIALSAANRASGGAAVVAAILSYAGRPIRLWRGGCWTRGFGWHEMRREDFALDGAVPLRRRMVALVDVPDLDLLPRLLPGRPAVTVRAGTELDFQMCALWLASWPVRWGLLRALTRFSPALLHLYRLTLGFGGDRSAMSVTLWGEAAGRRLERRWTLIAEKGEGVHVPALAAALLAEDALAGQVAPGARSAAGLLTIDRFDAAFAGLALSHGIVERPLQLSLYRRLLGSRFDMLPAELRSLHDICRDAGAAGEATVVRGRGIVARLAGALMRMPPAGRHELEVAFAERAGKETWTRCFGGHRFASELALTADGLLVERFGPLRFAFAVPCGAEGLEMKLRRWSLLGVPLPRALGPRIEAREWQDEAGRFRFEVAAALPIVGPIVHYSGWLRPNRDHRVYADPGRRRAAGGG